ncbi:hypothetical protein WA026_007246 [Henosepilachna vigintioctopunctata]|uniref:Uncharacterized protein n=1 Tax=Henosepilachna vigintioctopunctata TaxID=420089 RepID=A0AAW1UWQ3_9CUCU
MTVRASMIKVKLITIWLFFLRLTELKLCKKHLQNSLFPNYPTVPTYDIREWVVNLHLQRCTIVEVGEYFSALFLEDHNEMGSFNFYLGMCDHRTLKTWQFCSPELTQQRPNECSLDFDRVQYSRVHRRFCDVHYIILTQHPCNCSTILERKLHKVHGFPTCFVDPLPDSLCGPLNVCGLNKCNASTILGRIHSVQCDPKCKGKQLFCEWPVGQPTASIPAVYSLWSDWHEMEKIEDRTMGTRTIYYEAKCVNKYTYNGGIDCLGPGTSCCPTDILQCECKTFVEDVTLKVKRWIIFPIEHCTETSKDYDFSEDIVKQNSKKNGKVPFVLSRRDSQFDEEEEDDDDTDDIADEDITIEEETRSKNEAVVPNKTDDDENDEKTADDNEDLPLTSENQTQIAKKQEKSFSTKTQAECLIQTEILYYLFLIYVQRNKPSPACNEWQKKYDSTIRKHPFMSHSFLLEMYQLLRMCSERETFVGEHKDWLFQNEDLYLKCFFLKMIADLG